MNATPHSIATVTMNPTIDVSYDVGTVRHTHKMRAGNEVYAPGGGGINVARVYCRLGGMARCYYLSGGATGPALDGLIDQHKLVRTRIAIAGDTRVASAVHETGTGKEYRFVPKGPEVSGTEWRKALETLASADCRTMVLSGSLPPGVPVDFYPQVMAALAERGIDCVLDSSGEALQAGLEAGGVKLAKPSQGELESFVGSPLADARAIGEAAMDLVARGKAELVAVTMGHEGGVLARKQGWCHLVAPEVVAQSAVGAGDSFVAGMVFALNRGWDALEAFRYGMAAGSAAVLTPGTGLAYPDDIERLYAAMGPCDA